MFSWQGSGISNQQLDATNSKLVADGNPSTQHQLRLIFWHFAAVLCPVNQSDRCLTGLEPAVLLCLPRSMLA
jgi:hypothetical protein